MEDVKKVEILLEKYICILETGHEVSYIWNQQDGKNFKSK